MEIAPARWMDVGRTRRVKCMRAVFRDGAVLIATRERLLSVELMICQEPKIRFLI